jgi:hypothetical protein
MPLQQLSQTSESAVGEYLFTREGEIVGQIRRREFAKPEGSEYAPWAAFFEQSSRFVQTASVAGELMQGIFMRAYQAANAGRYLRRAPEGWVSQTACYGVIANSLLVHKREA